MTVVHSPLPWRFQDDDFPVSLLDRDGRFVVWEMNGSGEQRNVDAAFIVKAVNCHEELVAALSDLMDGEGDVHDKVIAARAALRHASGGE